MKEKIAVLGVSGMLGSMVLDYFYSQGYPVIATVRSQKEFNRQKYPRVTWRTLDAGSSWQDIKQDIKGAKWVISCIGIIKPHIKDDDMVKTETALLINSLFPYNLVRAAEKNKAMVLQIATDCVWDGKKGDYIETDLHNPTDVYGKTKSLGEVYSQWIIHIRCSIIGPENAGHLSLMDWFLHQGQNSKVNGFTNHKWNGLTTLHFAKICQGIIEKKVKIDHIQHVIPLKSISKAEMLKAMAKEFDRQDIKITSIKAKEKIDRTLATNNLTLNNKIWKAAGYKKIPSIKEMIQELKHYTESV